MLVDTHAHLNFLAFEKDLDEVIKRTQKEGVLAINVGSKYGNSKKAVEMAEKYEGMYAAIGLHPIHLREGIFKMKHDPEEEAGDLPAGRQVKVDEDDFNIDKYRELAQSSKKVVAIGEIGLDYYYRPKTKTKLEEFKNRQKEFFTKQLDLAKELDLPVIFHCRMAHKDMIEILKNYSGLRGVMHCFTGSIEEAQEYLKMGFYIGVNGIIFKLPLDEVIKQIPLEKILIETDCPYLTPPKAGIERNEPIFVKYVAGRIAELKNIDLQRVADVTTGNAKKLFKI